MGCLFCFSIHINIDANESNRKREARVRKGGPINGKAIDQRRPAN